MGLNFDIRCVPTDQALAARLAVVLGLLGHWARSTTSTDDPVDDLGEEESAARPGGQLMVVLWTAASAASSALRAAASGCAESGRLVEIGVDGAVPLGGWLTAGPLRLSADELQDMALVSRAVERQGFDAAAASIAAGVRTGAAFGGAAPGTGASGGVFSLPVGDAAAADRRHGAGRPDEPMRAPASGGSRGIGIGIGIVKMLKNSWLRFGPAPRGSGRPAAMPAAPLPLDKEQAAARRRRPTVLSPALPSPPLSGLPPPSVPNATPPAEPASQDAPVDAEPVLMAAAAPRRCRAGDAFTASFVTYTAAARESALRRLQQLGEDGDRTVSDLSPDRDPRWRVGAPVCVRLSGGPHVDVTPAEHRFEWNGHENVAAFAVTVSAGAPAGPLQLCFQVLLAEVPMAFVPMRLSVEASGTAAFVTASASSARADHADDSATTAQRREAAAPRSAFASYASKDAPAVSQRLSTLTRWAPGLDIFQDCLDLVPNDRFKPQLARQIRERDVFLLFWSRHAAASPWVRWEYETARETARQAIRATLVGTAGDGSDGDGAGNGPPLILPMPLEDPAIAPPPADLADAHLRDRFLLAGYALAQIAAEARASAPAPALHAAP